MCITLCDGLLPLADAALALVALGAVFITAWPILMIDLYTAATPNG